MHGAVTACHTEVCRMADLPLINPALAKKVWQSLPDPSTRRVARKLRQAGARISHMTVARWRSQGWRPLEWEQRHPLDAARAQLDDAVPLLTGDPLTTASVLGEQSAERGQLQKLTDSELLREMARALAVDARSYFGRSARR